ncbi:MAG: hypothetical protein K0R39_4738 [Symbiobacteriaceae bacterium]|jgi:hypothetical protein|nr:hypothetical protein [Symbiobacteriaceae bacterium]
MYEGEVFTYRNASGTQTVATNRQQRPAAPGQGRGEVPAAASNRMARLEGRITKLEEMLADLSGLVQQLTAAPQPEIDWAPPDPAPEPPKVTVQVQSSVPDVPAAPPPSDVKVTLFAGSSTEAILGHVNLTHQ